MNRGVAAPDAQEPNVPKNIISQSNLFANLNKEKKE